MDSFLTLIDYRSYQPNNLATFIEPDADLSLYKEKRKVDLLYSTLEPFSGKDIMEISVFFRT